MDPKNAIEAKSISKKFDIKAITRFGGTSKSGSIQVLSDISFTAKKGEILGIVGRNGSGKSTLLKLISGIMQPDAGTLSLSGKVAGILELGMGFQPELSGRDNIYVKCGMYGFNDKEIDSFVDEIITFSELGEQIDHPLRTYSSGMTAKLAFAILTKVKCDVLVVDEVLSIGDAGFNAKCKNVFEKMKKEGKTIVMASHNMATLELMCDRAMWIEEGKIKTIGQTLPVCFSFENDLTNSIETITKVAETGDAVSQNRLGEMYRYGNGTAINKEEAMKWFSKASDSGFAEASVNLGDILLEEGKKDDALLLYNKAAERGNAVASARRSLLSGEQGKRVESLLNEIKTLSDEGNTKAMKLYADILFAGALTVKSQKDAVELYKKAADSFNIQSQFQLGVCYRDGLGIEKNGEEAIKWFTISANNGNQRAKSEIANIYRKGIGVPADAEKAIEWYESAADCGDTSAMMQLHTMYRDGVGVEKNESKADYWASRNAERSLMNAEVQLADIYKSTILEETKNKCTHLYEKAISGGHANAMYTLGIMYRDGICVDADSKKAFELFSKASKQDHSFSLVELGNMYLKGIGCERNTEEAFNMFKKAANMGNINSILQLGKMYKHGIGTPVDMKKADACFNFLIESENVHAFVELKQD